MIEKMQETMVDDEKIIALEEKINEAKRHLNRCTLKLLKEQRRFEVVTATLEHMQESIGNGASPGRVDEKQVESLAVEQGQLRTSLMLGRAEEKRSAVVWIQHEQSRIRSLALGQESIYRTGTGPQCGGIASCVELRNGCFARKHFEPNRAGERCGVPYLAILLLVQAKEALTAVDDDALLAELGF